MGQHTRGRPPARCHRRAGRVQTRAVTISRGLWRVLRDRSPDEKRAREKVDRNHAREEWQRQRSRNPPKDVRSNEVIWRAHASGVLAIASWRSRTFVVIRSPLCPQEPASPGGTLSRLALATDNHLWKPFKPLASGTSGSVTSQSAS